MLHFLASTLFSIQKVFAQGEDLGPPVSITLPNPLGVSTFNELVKKLFNGLLIIATPLMVFFVFIAAFQMLTAMGDEEKFKRGKKTLFYAIVGFAVVLIGTVVADLISDILSGGLDNIT